MKEELKEKFKQVIPHLRFGIEEAKKEDKGTNEVLFGVLIVKPNQNGRIVFTFKADDFVEDLAELVGAPPMTDEARMDARAAAFLSRFGLTKKS